MSTENTLVNIFLDDVRNPKDVYPKDYFSGKRVWTVARSVEEVKEYLKNGVVSDMSLDHDLGLDLPTGYDLVKWMVETNTWCSGTINIHSANPIGAANMKALIDRYRP